MSHLYAPDDYDLTCDDCGMPKTHPIHVQQQAQPAAQAQAPGPRDGSTFVAPLDESRLNAQARAVWRVMARGEWLTLRAVSDLTGGTPEASVSARLRDFRKPEYGAHTVERRRREGQTQYEYRLLVRVLTHA